MNQMIAAGSLMAFMGMNFIPAFDFDLPVALTVGVIAAVAVAGLITAAILLPGVALGGAGITATILTVAGISIVAGILVGAFAGVFIADVKAEKVHAEYKDELLAIEIIIHEDNAREQEYTITVHRYSLADRPIQEHEGMTIEPLDDQVSRTNATYNVKGYENLVPETMKQINEWKKYAKASEEDIKKYSKVDIKIANAPDTLKNSLTRKISDIGIPTNNITFSE